MKGTFVIISVSERIDALNSLVRSIKAQPQMAGIDLNLLFQDPEDVAGQIEDKRAFRNIFIRPQKMGCHAARVELVRLLKYDFYINLDDDMELVEHTNYSRAIAKAMEPSTGFVLTNWAKTRKLLDAKVPKMRPEFVRQVLVYQGGGMVYAEKIAALMRALPAIGQTFDHAWPLTAYLNGYTNYRDLGSLAIHRVCGVGGMNSYLSANPVQLMMGQFVDFKKAKKIHGNGHDVLIPLDKDLTPLAKETHIKNRKT